jgi:large subunit ribosomal protein L15
MQLHQVFSNTKQKNIKRVGRGGKRGTYSGRGLKGQKSRSGANLRPGWRDLLKPVPKKRGFKFKSILLKPAIVNVGVLSDNFKDGEIVSPSSLMTKNLIARVGGRIPKVKILGTGEIKKKIILKECLISTGAKNKIEKAGGKIL